VLNDNEQKRLLDMERRLLADDPDFARSFEEQLRLPASLQPQIGSTGKIAIAVALLFSVVLLIAGFAAAGVAFAGATGVLWVMWRFSDDPTEK
jgi:hypothetical protein